MEEAGLDPETLSLEETTYSIDTGAEAFARIMARTPRPTAVLCGNDVLATGALMKAREMGLRVPEDVSITGFDDIDLAEIVSPALTTVHVPHRVMGRSAAQALLKLREGARPEARMELETVMTWRESLGPVPEGAD